jgi:NADPH-dependent ferric siderophore reductase
MGESPGHGAAQATVGQFLETGGPKGSAIISRTGIDLHVLIGDETGLPAISRRLEELPG